MTRQLKSQAQRAQEQYELAGRIVGRLIAKKRALVAQLEAVQAELKAADARWEHLAGHPDIPREVIRNCPPRHTQDPA